jgi:hypothetical protein
MKFPDRQITSNPGWHMVHQKQPDHHPKIAQTPVQAKP